MPVFLDLPDFANSLPPQGVLLGIDNGSKQLGVAVCDPMRMLATPLQTLPRGKFSDLLEALERIITSRKVVGLVIGLPTDLQGNTTPATQSARTLARNISQKWPDLPIGFWDERFSTKVVQREMIERADLTRANRAQIVDKLAASYILQGALDFLANSGHIRP